jgi:DNA-binding IclR family transcriptional regulator
MTPLILWFRDIMAFGRTWASGPQNFIVVPIPDLVKNKMKRRSTKREPVAETPYESRSLAKGIQILEGMAAAPGPASLREIAERIGLGKASALRLLRTLQGMGYLERDAHENYAPSREWPSPQQQNRLGALRKAARPRLEKLSAELGETVALAFLFEDVIRVIEVIESTHHIRMSNYRGGILQPYASSLGKSITAFQTPELAQRLLYTYGIFSLTATTLTDFRAIQDDLSAVRQRGYAWDREETVTGGTCIGAPIRRKDGLVYSAISLSMPKSRFTKRLEELLPALITDYAGQIAKALPAEE